MRKKEQRLWDRMREAIGLQARLERIENAVGVGRPDVDALVRNGGFAPVELKAIKAWPARPGTPVLGRDGLSLKQRNWLLDWGNWGGRAFIVVGVGPRDVFIFGHADHDRLNGFNTGQFRAAALGTSWQELLDLLRERP